MKASVWARRLPWSIVAATALLLGLGWLGIARVEQLSETARALSRAANGVFHTCAGAPAAGHDSQLPALRPFSYVLFLLAIVLLAAVYRWPADQRSPPLDPRGAARVSTVRPGQAGVRAGAGEILDVSRELPPAARAAGAPGPDALAAAADPEGAGPGHVAGALAGVLRDALCRRERSAAICFAWPWRACWRCRCYGRR